MKVEVAIIEKKEDLANLKPYSVDYPLWGTKYYPPMTFYIGFIPDDSFYIRMICEESNPLRTYKNVNDPVYKDSAMEAFLMFEPPMSSGKATVYLTLEANANGAMLATYGEKRMYRTYFLGADHAAFECKAKMEENSWSVDMRVPVRILEKVYGPLDLGEGSYFTCNFFKVSEHVPIEHYVAFSPIRTSIPSFHLTEYFAEAEIVRQYTE
ncbi:MAG: carbohydrate-binding family 9-like protein [Schaedlerella sp.]|nr:carbohydrate-binding family 9-like protein [Schaedlerella sp.]